MRYTVTINAVHGDGTTCAHPSHCASREGFAAACTLPGCTWTTRRDTSDALTGLSADHLRSHLHQPARTSVPA